MARGLDLRRRNPRPLRWAVAVVTTGLLAAGCSSDWDAAPLTVEPMPVAAVRAVSDCDELVERTRATVASAVDDMWTTTTWRSDGDMLDGATSDEATAGEAVPMAPSAAGADGFAQGSGRSGAAFDGAESAREQAGPDEATPEEVIGTNTQEAAVDEPDLVKTDGRRIVTVTDGVLRVTLLDDEPEVDGVLDLRSHAATEMFLRGDEVVLIGSASGSLRPMSSNRTAGFMEDGTAAAVDPAVPDAVPDTTTPDTTVPDTTLPDTTTPDTTVPDTTVPEPLPVEPLPTEPEPGPVPPSTIVPPEPTPLPFPSGTTLTTVSLADPATPTVTGTAAVEGDYVSARMVGERIRVVVRGTPRAMDEVFYAPSEAEARAALAAIDEDDLLPLAVVDGVQGTLGGCGDVLLLGSGAAAVVDGAAQRSFAPPAGLSTVTALTVGEDLTDLQPVTIQGAAETVYASTEALYVTSSTWADTGSATDVHRFALPSDGPVVHTGSGRAPGRLLNQFSLSERQGALRVVTTVDDAVPARVDAADMWVPPTAGRLTVLDTEGATLDEIGHLDGLGPGEEVKSVRFVGELGYVVTFRTTDPLYALDLSDPRAPRLLGELKIPGFSEYLHPVGDGLLLGVGREADPETGVETGAKVSLFDISDPASMAEVDQIIVPGGWTPVGSDHRAFLWDESRAQAVVPMERPDAGGVAMVLRVRDGRLDRVAELRHGTEFGSTPIRSLVADGDLWTVSATGLGRTSADSPGTVDGIPF